MEAALGHLSLKHPQWPLGDAERKAHPLVGATPWTAWGGMVGPWESGSCVGFPPPEPYPCNFDGSPFFEVDNRNGSEA